MAEFLAALAFRVGFGALILGTLGLSVAALLWQL